MAVFDWLHDIGLYILLYCIHVNDVFPDTKIYINVKFIDINKNQTLTKLYSIAVQIQKNILLSIF